MKKRLLAMLLAAAMCTGLAACSSDTGTATTPEGGETAESGDGSYNIDVILKTTASEYWQ